MFTADWAGSSSDTFFARPVLPEPAGEDSHSHAADSACITKPPTSSKPLDTLVFNQEGLELDESSN